MKQMVKSVIMLISSLMIFTAIVYAWFSISNENNVQPLTASIIERNVDLEIEYGLNGGSYESFDNPAEINAYLSSIAPGDTLDIRITVINDNQLSSPDLDLKITLLNLRTTETSIDYDLLDFFYLVDGAVHLTWYASLEDYSSENHYSYQSIEISQIDENSINFQGHELFPSRISNVLNHYYDEEELIVENNIDVVETTFASQHIVVITFSFGLDPYTPDKEIGFQNGELLIDGLYSFIGNE